MPENRRVQFDERGWKRSAGLRPQAAPILDSTKAVDFGDVVTPRQVSGGQADMRLMRAGRRVSDFAEDSARQPAEEDAALRRSGLAASLRLPNAPKRTDRRVPQSPR